MAWYDIPGVEQDVAISTRVRFARNIDGYPFPSRLDAVKAREMIGKVGQIMDKNGFQKLDFADVSRLTAESLVEKRYASPHFVRQSNPHALFLNEPCNLAVMVCEEDHLRIQCIQPGLSLQDALEGADKIEQLLDNAFEISFDGKLGYLTACPTNVGSAMRASVMLALPVLTDTGRIESMARSLEGMGLVLRGMFGEGSGAPCGMYQISNRPTPGVTEEEILEQLSSAVQRLIDAERNMRESRYGADPDGLLDACRRAEGALRHAHILSAGELLSLSGRLRAGIALGILPHIRMEALNALLVKAMPATLTLSADPHPKNDRERDILRAKMVQEGLFGA